jgi:hypothetical protein
MMACAGERALACEVDAEAESQTLAGSMSSATSTNVKPLDGTQLLQLAAHVVAEFSFRMSCMADVAHEIMAYAFTQISTFWAAPA